MSGMIPNPLDDAGVKEEIEVIVKRFCETPLYCKNINNLQESIKMKMQSIAKWSYQQGFSTAWRIQENRKK